MDVAEVHHALAIQVEFEGVQAECAELVGATGGGLDVAGPAHAEVVVVHIRTRRAVPPMKVDLGIDAVEQGLRAGRDGPHELPGAGVGELARPVQLAVEIRGVEVLAFESVARRRIVRGEERRGGDDLEGRYVGGQIAAAGIEHVSGGAELLADPLKGCDWGGRIAVVVAQKHAHVVGVGSDHRNGLERLTQRQGVVFVPEQHDRLVGRIERQLPVRRAVVFAVGDLRVAHHGGRIEHAQAEASQQQAAQRLVNPGFRDQPLADGGQEMLVLDAAVQIGAGFEGH